MNAKALSMRRIYALAGGGLLLTGALAAVLGGFLLRSNAVAVCGLALTLLTAVWFAVYTILVRRKLAAFSEGLCRSLDDMMNGVAAPQADGTEETLFVKLHNRVNRLYEVMEESRRRAAKDKAELQALTSDISHQVKTPLANLKMVTSTLLSQDMPEAKQREFLQAMEQQLDKLDFLMQAMVKASRLETGVITLVKKPCSLYETLAAALGVIILSAEAKALTVTVDCPEDLSVSHDTKWTAEALGNILDNAVKYTPDGGEIRITAARMEMYTRIDIADNGRGILEARHADVFKRFYREEAVHEVPGIGIGLFLSREIITLQNGYIKLSSAAGQGSVFSVFLPNL